MNDIQKHNRDLIMWVVICEIMGWDIPKPKEWTPAKDCNPYPENHITIHPCEPVYIRVPHPLWPNSPHIIYK